MPRAARERVDAIADRGRHGRGLERRAQRQRPRARQELDREHVAKAVEGLAQLARRVPAHRDVVFLHARGRDGVDARRDARRFISVTSPAWAYWAIISPESTPAVSARNGGRPKLRLTSSRRSVRRSLIDADVGERDREEVERVADRRAVEVAVAHERAVEQHRGVVDRGREFDVGDGACVA